MTGQSVYERLIDFTLVVDSVRVNLACDLDLNQVIIPALEPNDEPITVGYFLRLLKSATDSIKQQAVFQDWKQYPATAASVTATKCKQIQAKLVDETLVSANAGTVQIIFADALYDCKKP